MDRASTHSHSDVWSFCVLLRECERVCLKCVCQSATFLQCWAPFDFCILPLSPPSPPSLLLFSTSLPLYAPSLHYSSLPPFSFFLSFLPVSSHHVLAFTSLALPPPLNHPPLFLFPHNFNLFLSSFLHLLSFNPATGAVSAISLYCYGHPSILSVSSYPTDQ